MKDLMMKDLEIYFPSEWRRTVDYWEYRTYELAIRLDDGGLFIYDHMNKTLRRVPKYGKRLTEDERKNEFGQRLRRIMYSKGMTQDDLSKATGISQTMISQYISGKVNPSFTKVDMICEVLDCTMDKLRYVDRDE